MVVRPFEGAKGGWVNRFKYGKGYGNMKEG